MSRLSVLGQKLYTGKLAFEFVARRRIWYAISALILVFAVSGLVVRGLNQGVEFRGGVEFVAQIDATDENVDRLRDATIDTGIEVGDPIVTTSNDDAIRVQVEPLSNEESAQIRNALLDAGAEEISINSIGPQWGQEVADSAIRGLVIFLGLVILFIWAYFREWKMSVSAITALAHDIVISVGVYAWSGFEVTPATVTGFLTILGYSLYDTVVVFDKVRENTHKFELQNSQTYAELSNLAVNQTLVRSINTTVTAVIPVVSILGVAVFVLGTGPLKDLSLALFVGMVAGTFSSIFIATPLAVQLKEREPLVRQHTKRVLDRRAKDAAKAAATEEPAPAEDGGEAAPVVTPAGPARKVAVSPSAKRAQPQRTSRSQRKRR